jgi:hypothetical protein
MQTHIIDVKYNIWNNKIFRATIQSVIQAKPENRRNPSTEESRQCTRDSHSLRGFRPMMFCDWSYVTQAKLHTMGQPIAPESLTSWFWWVIANQSLPALGRGCVTGHAIKLLPTISRNLPVGLQPIDWFNRNPLENLPKLHRAVCRFCSRLPAWKLGWWLVSYPSVTR